MVNGNVFIATSNGLHRLGTDGPIALADHDVTALAGNGAGRWAIVDGDAVWRVPNSGEAALAGKLESDRANCLLPDTTDVWIGAARANLYRLVDGNVERIDAFDAVPGRANWYTPWGGPPDVRSIARDPAGTVYVNIHVGGVARSADGGATWTDTMDINADVHEVIAHTDRAGHAYVASAIGLGVSTDGAGSWTFETDGLHADYCRAVALSQETLFVSASLGHHGRNAALYRRPIDSGQPLERCRSGLPEWFSTNLNTFCIAAAGNLVVAGDADGTVYVSEDDGANWQVAASNLPRIRAVQIA